MEEIKFCNCEFLSQYLKGYFPDLTEDEESYEQAYLVMATINKETFCSKLKAYREQAEYTQISVCNALNITQPTYSSWENGRHLPKPEFIKKLSVIYRLIDPVYFLCEKYDDYFGEISIPLLPDKLFMDLKFEDFTKAKEEFEYFPYSERFPVLKSKGYDFAFYVNDNLMYGADKGFHFGDYLLCQYKFMEGKSKTERLKFLNGQVVIMNYNGLRAEARQIFYSEKTHEVTVVFWNPKGLHILPDRTLTLLGMERDHFDRTFSEDDIEIFGLVVDYQGSLLPDK